jgi:hypothetical protein
MTELDQLRERCRATIARLGFQYHYKVNIQETDKGKVYTVTLNIQEPNGEERHKIKLTSTELDDMMVKLDAVEDEVTDLNENTHE